MLEYCHVSSVRPYYYYTTLHIHTGVRRLNRKHMVLLGEAPLKALRSAGKPKGVKRLFSDSPSRDFILSTYTRIEPHSLLRPAYATPTPNTALSSHRHLNRRIPRKPPRPFATSVSPIARVAAREASQTCLLENAPPTKWTSRRL